MTHDIKKQNRFSIGKLTFFSIKDIMQMHQLLSTYGISSRMIFMHDNMDVEHAVDQHTFSSSAGILLDFNCPKSSELIEHSSNIGYFNTRNKWLIYEDMGITNASILVDQLKITNLYIDAELSYVNLAMPVVNFKSV